MFQVSLTVEEMNVEASGSVVAVRQAAEACGGSDVEVTMTDDGRGFRAVFSLEAATDEDARETGHRVLEAVKASEYVWSVGATKPFRR